MLSFRGRLHDRGRPAPLHRDESEEQYVDSHGQSEVGFAFCHLLGFDLLPRLKAIQKLYRPVRGRAGDYPNLRPS